MARIKFGAAVVGIRGSAGGLTFSANAGGNYVKLWGQSSRPRTEAQQLQRGNVSRMPALWRALTSAQKNAWAVWAAQLAQQRTNSLGEPYNARAFPWFVALNCQLLRAGRSPISAAPTIARPSAPVITSFTFNSTGSPFTAQIAYNPAIFAGGEDIIIEAALKPGGGLISNYFGWRIIVAGIPSPTGTYTFPTEWRDAFGTPAVGDQGWVRVYKQTTEGYRGTMAQLVTVFS